MTTPVPVSSQQLQQIAVDLRRPDLHRRQQRERQCRLRPPGKQLGHKKIKQELTAGFAGGALALVLVGGVLSLALVSPARLDTRTMENTMTDTQDTILRRGEARDALQQVLYEIKRVIVGQDAMLERLLVSLLAGGHVLLEGVPGLAKTLTVKTLVGRPGRLLRPHPVHPGPRAGRPRGHARVAA